jgi:hypothetical protein
MSKSLIFLPSQIIPTNKYYYPNPNPSKAIIINKAEFKEEG